MKLLIITLFAFVALSVQSESWSCDFIDANGNVANKPIRHTNGRLYPECELLFKSMLKVLNSHPSLPAKWSGKKWAPCSSKPATVKSITNDILEFKGALHSRVGHHGSEIEAFWNKKTNELLIM